MGNVNNFTNPSIPFPIKSADADLKLSEASQNALNTAIAEYLYRAGEFAIADCFCQEASVDRNEELKSKFQCLNSIIQDLNVGKINGSLEWAIGIGANRSLIFHLYALDFVLKMKSGVPPKELVRFAQSNFDQFYDLHLEDIQKLMGSILWISNVSKSPYQTTIFDVDHLIDLIRVEFTTEFCVKNGILPYSSLEMA